MRRTEMVIERVTGGKPQEVRKAEQSAQNSKRADAAKDDRPDKTGSGEVSVSAEVSERSKAAIKAYRIASETKPDISRAQRVAQIKAQVAQGTYDPSASDVAASIIQSVVKES